MATWTDEHRRDDEDDDDREAPSLADQARYGDDAEPTVPCPFCRRPVHEETDVCHLCGNYIGGGDDPSPRRPRWVVVGVAVLVVATLVAYVLGR